MSSFWVDSDALIQSMDHYYRFKTSPGFWTLLENACRANEVSVSIRVYAELRRKHDQVARWISAVQCDNFRAKPDNLGSVNTNLDKLLYW